MRPVVHYLTYVQVPFANIIHSLRLGNLAWWRHSPALRAIMFSSLSHCFSAIKFISGLEKGLLALPLYSHSVQM